MSTDADSNKPGKSHFSIYVGLFNLSLAILMVLVSFLMTEFKDALPANSLLRGSGTAMVVAFTTWPLAILFSLIGIVQMIIASIRRKSARPKGSPLSLRNKIALAFSGIFLLVAIDNLLMLAGLGHPLDFSSLPMWMWV